MKTTDLIDAFGALDDETVLAAHKKSEKTISLHRRIQRAALIAAALVMLLSLGALAYYVASHANTAALMEAGPMSNGHIRPEIDEAGMAIIDSSAIDLGLSQTSNDTTITLDSMMGYADPKESVLYLTFTVTPPEGFAFPEDMKDWCFWDMRWTSVPDDLQIPYAASTVKNPDGTASVLWLMMPMGDPSGHRLHIEIGGFGMASKEVCEDLYMGTREIELPGEWVFDLELPELPATQEIAFDAAALKEAGLPMTALRLNSFGGIAELEKQEVSQLKLFRETYGEQLKADFPTVDFAHMDDAEFNALCMTGDIDGSLTEEEFAHLQQLLYSLPPVDQSIKRPETVTLEYPDGTEYTVSFGEYGDNLWINWDEQGLPYCQILFLNPQPLSEASAIVINGIRIPLK